MRPPGFQIEAVYGLHASDDNPVPGHGRLVTRWISFSTAPPPMFVWVPVWPACAAFARFYLSPSWVCSRASVTWPPLLSPIPRSAFSSRTWVIVVLFVLAVVEMGLDKISEQRLAVDFVFNPLRVLAGALAFASTLAEYGTVPLVVGAVAEPSLHSWHMWRRAHCARR